MRRDQIQAVILYDGVCNFCNGAVRFILKRDKHRRFHFAPIQGVYGQQKLAGQGLSTESLDTFLLLENGVSYQKSEAALRILPHLSSAWPSLGVLRCLPLGFRDYVYMVFAKNRYRLFGRKPECTLPNQEQRSRFLL